jgi:TM2 domain-containing membrane protein YozV
LPALGEPRGRMLIHDETYIIEYCFKQDFSASGHSCGSLGIARICVGQGGEGLERCETELVILFQHPL